MRHRLPLVVLALLLAAWPVGCHSAPFTRQRYETLYVGQPDWDVRNVLGPPTYQEADVWTYVHTDTPYCWAVIYFRDGKVTGKEWSYEPLPARKTEPGD